MHIKSIVLCNIPYGKGHVKATSFGSWFLFFTRPNTQRERVISFIDGFNLYHAIDRLNRSELKWINLTTLSQGFLKPTTEELTAVFYFSAYAHHISAAVQKRQRLYIKALELVGTRTILGHFKKKHRKCPDCHHTWMGYEEKETDVNIALFLLDSAYQDIFDRALVISNDL